MNRQETINQLGGTGFSGAFAYTGTSRFSIDDRTATMQVNGKPGYKSFITITIEGSDLYTVRYITLRGLKRVEIAKVEDVFCEDLQGTVEHMYDSTMNATNGGWIPLGKAA